MSFVTAFQDIKTKIEAEWPALEPAVPIVYENDITDPFGDEWLLVDIEEIEGVAVSIGAPGHNIDRSHGRIGLYGFISVGKAQVRAIEISNKASRIFVRQDFGVAGVKCGARTSLGPSTRDGRWYGWCAAVPFWVDEES